MKGCKEPGQAPEPPKIIVDEASEGHEDVASVANSDDSSSHSLAGEPSADPAAAAGAPGDVVRHSGPLLEAEPVDSESLNSDVSLNLSLFEASSNSNSNSDIANNAHAAPSAAAGAARQQSRQQQQQQQQPLFIVEDPEDDDGAAGCALDQDHQLYMQTIPEDLRDEWGPSELASVEDGGARGPAPEHRPAARPAFAGHYHRQCQTVHSELGGGGESSFDKTKQGSRCYGEQETEIREPLLAAKQTGARVAAAAGRQQHVKAPPDDDYKSSDDRAPPRQADEPSRPKSSVYLRAPKRQDMEADDEQTLQHIETYIEKCMCIGIICLKWFLLRQRIRKIVEHKYFDQCILVLIIISSGTLALEDKHLSERPTLMRTLDVLDTIFTIIFSLEMIFKWLAFGMRRYFGNIWSWLDFIIVMVGLINLMASIFGTGKIQALKTMRTLRAMRGLRPLRALQRFQGMRVVVNALIQAIPSIFNVLLVCLIFWLIFSIMGVQMFGGKFWRCVSPETGEMVSYEQAANKWECIERNLTWTNPQINFDNVLNAYLALFQVATFKGWISIMDSAADSRMRDEQPVREANIYMYFYFVFFVIFGSFFTLNLFIGVIIDNFNEQKKKTGGSLEIFMTEDQKKYYHAMKKMRNKRPVKAMTRPKFKLQAYMFDLTTNKKFDLAIMLIIGLNMFVMALEHYGQSPEFSQFLENLNLVFIGIFTLECVCKVFAMRHYYFREPWNMFDFIVVNLSILGVMTQNVANYFVSPTLLRVVRIIKVGRSLRLVKGAKGVKTLLFALAMSLPALFNICLLLFLVMFIYAIFGMSLFMNVRKRAGIDETFNFETFTSSIIVLFQISTSAAWDVVLDPLMDEENDCQKPDPENNIVGTCGNKSIAIFYLVSYVIVTYLIIINMYIAVILENYSQAIEDVTNLTDDDYEMYYEIWQKFDPDGTQYLPFEKLSDFVDALEDPLRIPKPNELVLAGLDINIYEGNQCYCVDILDALTKYFFIQKGIDIQVNEHLQRVQSELHEVSLANSPRWRRSNRPHPRQPF
jgi:hypothetical protein